MKSLLSQRALRLLTLLLGFAMAAGLLAAGASDLPPGGSFVDDDGNIHEGAIEAVFAAGITKGCNPPANTRFCPGESVTRGQMAAFLRRAFDLPFVTRNYFSDDDGSIFEGDINAVAAAGITKGCNPPANTRFCPGETVTRGQMAAFLRRAFDLPFVTRNYFSDDDGSIFEGDINAIAAAGITKGCNPPANTRFCPSSAVRRDQMASFLSRGLGLSAIAPPPFTGFASPLSAFADFEGVPLLDDQPAYAGPAHPTSLSGVQTSEFVDGLLEDAAVEEALTRRGFVVVPSDYRLFHYVYDMAAYEGQPNYVTTDVAYHLWHLVFDKILREVEQQVMLPALESLVLGMLADARTQTVALSATPLADHALRVEEWFEAAATLLGLDVGPIGSRAQQEVALVLGASQTTASPVTSFGICSEIHPENCIAYALFRPKGHYTRNEDLERYFRTMSLFGQVPFSTVDADQLRLGLLTIGLLAEDPELEDSWTAIYEPTAFLVGISDDYTPFELRSVVEDIVPSGFGDPGAFASSATVGSVAAGLYDLRGIAIDPERPSVRFMGTRVTLDGYVLDQLIDPSVPGRFDPSALDVAAVLGSEFALDVQQATQSGSTPDYAAMVDRLRFAVERRAIDDWAATVYDAWLYAIQAVLATHGPAFPEYMRGATWAAKATQTGLGSYAELKHDTILYAKPAFAEGEGPPEPPVPPRHWVEPDPVAFLRLSAAARLMSSGLTDRGLLPVEYADLITDLTDALDRLARIAGDELAARPLAAADNAWLLQFGPLVESLWLRSADFENGFPSDQDNDAAIIADIATTPLGALEIGTGRVDLILVLVPNDLGVFQVAVGGVYSYHEFWGDPSNRLTDEEWRAMLVAGSEPGRPAWEDVLFP